MADSTAGLEGMEENLLQVFQNYEGRQGDVIPILQDIQDVLGYVPQEAMAATAKFLGVSEAYVYGVTTFYSQFKLVPQGKHEIKVCLGTACHVRGGQKIMETVEKKLGIKAGGTTGDLLFSADRVACFGSCALAPVVVIDGKVHGDMTSAKVESLLNDLHREDAKTAAPAEPASSKN